MALEGAQQTSAPQIEGDLYFALCPLGVRRGAG